MRARWWNICRSEGTGSGLILPLHTTVEEPRSARPRVGALALVVFALSRKILQRLCAFGRCKSARPGGGRALRGGAQARLYSAHWHQAVRRPSRPVMPPAPSTTNLALV